MEDELIGSVEESSKPKKKDTNNKRCYSLYNQVGNFRHGCLKIGWNNRLELVESLWTVRCHVVL